MHTHNYLALFIIRVGIAFFPMSSLVGVEHKVMHSKDGMKFGKGYIHKRVLYKAP
jgi:hypothetical protein